MIIEPVAVNGAIAATGRVAQALRSSKEAGKSVGTLMAAGYGSLTSVASVARVEPICMVDSDVANYEHIDTVMSAAHSMFTGFYLQAINLAGTINGVTLAEKLSPLNPNRSAFESLVPGIKAGQRDSLKHRLPLSGRKTPSFAMEADKPSPDGVRTDSSELKSLNESSSLSVGRMVEVTIKEDDQMAKIPVAIRLQANIISSTEMENLFAHRDMFDMDLIERFHSWRSGKLSLIEMAFCVDLIDKSRKAALKTQLGAELLNREVGHLTSSFTTQRKSLATCTNIAIMSKDTLDRVEVKLGGPFTNSHVRHTVFDNTNLMILVVIDKAWDRVRMYVRGIDMPTDLSIKQMKSGKGGSDSAMDIMKALLTGNAPANVQSF